MSGDPLAGLHDIHLPAPVSWWPPAPGWWAVAAAGLVLLGAVAWLVRRMVARRRRRRAVMARLDRLVAAFRQDGDGQALSAGVTLLLRQVALAGWPRVEVAPLTGDAWLAFLDRTGGGGGFMAGPGRVLASASYGAPEVVDGEALAVVARRWLERALKRVVR